MSRQGLPQSRCWRISESASILSSCLKIAALERAERFASVGQFARACESE